MKTKSSKGPLSALGVTLVALLALGAFLGSASASAATQHWYGYTGSTRLLEKAPTEVVADGSKSTQIKFKAAGAELTIECRSLDAGGTIENPSGGGNGTLGGAGITFGECAVTTPAQCTVPSTIETNALKGETTTFEGSPAVKYSPASGSALTTFTVSNCSFWSGSKTLTGSFTALYGGTGGNWQVTDLSSAGLTWAGTAVKLNTAYQLNSNEGDAVSVGIDTAPAGQHWYLGGAPSEGSKAMLPEGSAVGYSSVEGSTSFTIAATIGGVKFKIQCGGSSAEGTVENPVGGGAGAASGTIAFGGCTVSEPTGGKCSVDGGGAVSRPLSGLATEAKGAPAVSFSPAEKTTIATFTISGASCPAALKGPKSLTGSLTGVPDPFGTYAFSGNEGLAFAGQTATLAAQSTLETSTGERLVLAP